MTAEETAIVIGFALAVIKFAHSAVSLYRHLSQTSQKVDDIIERKA